MKTYFHMKFHYKAQDDDIRDALQMLDPKGTEVRRPSLKKNY